MAEIFNEILSETESAVRDTLRRFAVDVLRPVGKALDVLSPDDVIAKNSLLWEAHKKYADLGMNMFGEEASVSPVEAARLRALSSEMMVGAMPALLSAWGFQAWLSILPR